MSDGSSARPTERAGRRIISGERKGGIRSRVAVYHLDKTLILANLQTRLKRLDRTTQERLINWGYAICDTGMRKWVTPGAPRPARLLFHGVQFG